VTFRVDGADKNRPCAIASLEVLPSPVASD
jgi:hypothetical protein